MNHWKGRYAGARGAERWPATRLALRRQRRYRRYYVAAVLGGTATQIALQAAVHAWEVPVPSTALVLFGLIFLIPCYITAWIVPGVVAANVARVRASGRWEALALSRLSSLDLWLSFTFAPILPLLVLAAALCWPYVVAGRPWDEPDSFGWAFWGGLAILPLVSGAAFGALGVICGFHARSASQAVVRTVAIIVVICYARAGLALAAPAVGGGAPQLLGEIVSFVPAGLLSPSWMVGVTISSIGLPTVAETIVPSTVGVFAGLAGLLGAVSFLVLCRARRPRR